MQIIKDMFNLPQGAVWLKADLHVHTPASRDISEKWANSKAEDVVKIALEKEIDIIAITDHNTVAWCVRWTPSLGQDRGYIKIGSRYPQGV